MFSLILISLNYKSGRSKGEQREVHKPFKAYAQNTHMGPSAYSTLNTCNMAKSKSRVEETGGEGESSLGKVIAS